MKTKVLTIAVLLAASMAMAPTAMAHHAEDESTRQVFEYYLLVNEDGVSVWQETNDHFGLQTTETEYGHAEDEWTVETEDDCDGDTFKEDATTGDAWCVVPPDEKVAP